MTGASMADEDAAAAGRIVTAARALVGVPFRLHGRDPACGLDCVGLAALALAVEAAAVPGDYALRSTDTTRVRAWLAGAGLRPVATPRPGDLVLVRPGPLHLHLMIGVPGGFIHAHAGLRRVVEMPGASPWPVVGHWRA